MNLDHGPPFVRPMRIIAGDYADLADADAIVIGACVGQRPGQTRLELQTNAGIFRKIVPQITAVNEVKLRAFQTPAQMLKERLAEL